ncbi:MAG: fumarate hydratase [Candidatus Bathyarchaeia archaeon]|nr:fumarate hydratase [Candidatus Bathyarchaeota archaeon]
MSLSGDILESVCKRLLLEAATKLPGDVLRGLEEAYSIEDNKYARSQLKIILESVKIARDEGIPICQDTGNIHVYLKLGRGVVVPADISLYIDRAVRKATKEIPLRPNMVHPLTRVNSMDNSGRGLPLVTMIPDPTIDGLEVAIMLKGAGSENLSRTYMLKPTEGFESIRRIVLESIAEALGRGCPPYIISVAIGGTLEYASIRAKINLLEPIDKPSCIELADLERILLDDINKLGIGAMGLGGRVTAMRVKLDYMYCHTASLPVAIQIQCWALRKAKAYITSSGEIVYQEL